MRCTTLQAAALLGYSGPNAAGVTRAALARWGVPVVGRTCRGENLYEVAAVRAGAMRRPGQGRRTDLLRAP
jgi:hypothetical protein